MAIKYIIGIDEVGRGPLAGPVGVGIFCVPEGSPRKIFLGLPSGNLRKYFKGARDSKKLSAAKREEIFRKIKQAAKENKIHYVVTMESAKVIDTKGISFAIKNCMKKGLQKMLRELKVNPKEVKVLLDGWLKAPKEFTNQQSIIKGDDKEMVISLASIAAKVTRDAYMKNLAKKYPEYGFEVHKGYGTLKHRQNILRYGTNKEHRQTFLKNIYNMVG